MSVVNILRGTEPGTGLLTYTELIEIMGSVVTAWTAAEILAMSSWAKNEGAAVAGPAKAMIDINVATRINVQELTRGFRIRCVAQTEFS